jgi:hypothetical protein
VDGSARQALRMITEITLDAGMIGRAIGFPDGYITTLQQTQSQSPAWQIENFIAIPYPHGPLAA